MGATTIWERWDSMLPDGTINPGQMTSFNHYALGAVADWMHRTIGGIAPLEPGYAEVLIAPQPGGGITWARASLETRHGPVVGVLEAGSRRRARPSRRRFRSRSPRWSGCPTAPSSSWAPDGVTCRSDLTRSVRRQRAPPRACTSRDGLGRPTVGAIRATGSDETCS